MWGVEVGRTPRTSLNCCASPPHLNALTQSALGRVSSLRAISSYPPNPYTHDFCHDLMSQSLHRVQVGAHSRLARFGAALRLLQCAGSCDDIAIPPRYPRPRYRPGASTPGLTCTARTRTAMRHHRRRVQERTRNARQLLQRTANGCRPSRGIHRSRPSARGGGQRTLQGDSGMIDSRAVAHHALEERSSSAAGGSARFLSKSGKPPKWRTRESMNFFYGAHEHDSALHPHGSPSRSPRSAVGRGSLQPLCDAHRAADNRASHSSSHAYLTVCGKAAPPRQAARREDTLSLCQSAASQ